MNTRNFASKTKARYKKKTFAQLMPLKILDFLQKDQLLGSLRKNLRTYLIKKYFVGDVKLNQNTQS